MLKELIKEQMEEVKDAVNVEFYTVHVKVDAELLWQRIQARLANEPDRAKYNEDKRDWMDKTLQFYDTFEWDLVRAAPMPRLKLQGLTCAVACRCPTLF